tara:strand:- start:217 stop:504 length:288 start_codon:yes stop_codon:yes gene_type:complete
MALTWCQRLVVITTEIASAAGGAVMTAAVPFEGMTLAKSAAIGAAIGGGVGALLISAIVGGGGCSNSPPRQQLDHIRLIELDGQNQGQQAGDLAV